MDAMSDDRRHSTRLALRFLADAGVRREMAQLGVDLNSPVVVCEWDTTVGEVLEMLKKTRARAARIAIRRGETMQALFADFGVTKRDEWSLNTDEVHPSSKIGHMYEALLPRKTWDISRGMVEEQSISLSGLSFTSLV